MRSFSISLKNDRITMISLASGYHISRSLDALPQDSALQLLNIFPPSKSEKLEVKRIVDIAQDSPCTYGSVLNGLKKCMTTLMTWTT